MTSNWRIHKTMSPIRPRFRRKRKKEVRNRRTGEGRGEGLAFGTLRRCTVAGFTICKRHIQRHVQWPGLLRRDGGEGGGTHTWQMQ